MNFFRWGMRAKLLLALLLLALISFAIISFVAIYYIGRITDFAQLSNISLGNTAASKSSAVLENQMRTLVYQKALDVAGQVKIALSDNLSPDGESLHNDPQIASITTQEAGDTGYIFLYESETGIMRVHPDPEMINQDIHNKLEAYPELWKILSASLNGSASSGFFDWQEQNGTSNRRFMYAVPVEGTRYMVAVAVSENEFSEQSSSIRDEINLDTISTSQYIAQQREDMYRILTVVIICILVFVVLAAVWLSRRITVPIEDLTEGSKIITEGNFDYRVSIKSGDELEQLAQQYNAMAANLKESYSNLEQKVEQRTAELKDANLRLQEEITQRELAQDALRQSEIKYRHLVEKANCIILEMDTEGKVVFFNKFGLDFFGYREDEILGKSVVGTIVPLVDTEGKDLELMIQDITLHPEQHTYNENENVRRNGERVWVVWLNQPIFDKDSRLSGVLCIGLARTALKQAEEIRESRAKEKAAANERNRLARDLHDAVSQTLFSASLIADILPRLWEKNQEEGRRRLTEIRELPRGALAEMRTLLLELRPSSLMEADLGVLLQQLGESVTGRARIPVAVEIEGKCSLPAETKLSLYRIAQEALNNVAKHSGAHHVDVKLVCGNSQVELTVCDDGVGFDPSVIAPDSLGLGIMRERAKNIEASLSLESSKDHGTRISVILSSEALQAKTSQPSP